MLEEHVVEWIRIWKAGFGLMGEQGAESIHSYFNDLRKTYAGIPDSAGTKVVYYPSNLRCYNLRTIRTFE